MRLHTLQLYPPPVYPPTHIGEVQRCKRPVCHAASLSLPVSVREGQALLLRNVNQTGAPTGCRPLQQKTTPKSADSTCTVKLFGSRLSAVHQLSLQQLQHMYDTSAALGLKKHVLLLVNRNSCSYCRAVEPEFELVACHLASSAGVTVAAVDADQPGVLEYAMEELQVHAVPSILLFQAGSSLFFRYHSAARDAGSLLRFVEAMCNYGLAETSVRWALADAMTETSPCKVQVVYPQKLKASGATNAAVTNALTAGPSAACSSKPVSAELAVLAAAAGLLLAVMHAAVTLQLQAAAACSTSWLEQLLLRTQHYGQGQADMLQPAKEQGRNHLQASAAPLNVGQDMGKVHNMLDDALHSNPQPKAAAAAATLQQHRLLATAKDLLCIMQCQCGRYLSVHKALWLSLVACVQSTAVGAWELFHNGFQTHVTQVFTQPKPTTAAMIGGNGQQQQQHSVSSRDTPTQTAETTAVQQELRSAQAAVAAAVTALLQSLEETAVTASATQQQQLVPLPGQHVEAFRTGDFVAVSIEEINAFLQLLDAGMTVEEILTLSREELLTVAAAGATTSAAVAAVSFNVADQAQPGRAGKIAAFIAGSSDHQDSTSSCNAGKAAGLSPLSPASAEAYDAQALNEVAAAAAATTGATLESQLQQCWDDLLAVPAGSTSSRAAEQRLKPLMQQVIEAGGVEFGGSRVN